MHNGGVAQPMEDPCARHGCHVCCLETRMTLTEADVGRLDGAGFKNFAHVNGDGDLELENHAGRCVFLNAGRCDAYAVRPEGCQLYPLILDLRNDRVIKDELCPHRGDFPILSDHADRLRRSVEKEWTEAGHRRRRTDG